MTEMTIEIDGAYCIGFVNDKDLYIHSLYAKKKGTRKGTIALGLLCVAALRQFPSIRYVKLDDSTGVNPPINIYYKLGFRVKDDLTERYVKWSTWLKSYKGKLANPSEERRITIHELIQNIEMYKK